MPELPEFPFLPPFPALTYLAPNMEAGKVTSPAKGWVRVKFKKSFAEKPVVIAFMESTEGWFTPPSFKIPKTSTTSVPTFSVPVPKIRDILPSLREDFRKKVARDFHDKFIERAGNWYVLNPLRDALADVFYGIGYVAGAAMNYMWDIMVKPKLDELAENVENAMRSAISTLVSRVNSSISSLVSSANASIENISESLSTAVEKAIEEWYKAIGLEKGQLPQFALVRNVSKDGFEVWIPRPLATVHYIAVGIPLK